ncbi:hypothetical protein V2S66_08180 [Streptomyces sp. V4-01]|uniref:Uncharacterized protein n=1 Tax=Actinacidiphila polyblastidii TaxID=3110430 RepID=A0ABU7P800_9ACTN|nr:hypothetical protein [Streptomyces sp. V4-01]
MIFGRDRRKRRERALVHLQSAARLLDDERPHTYIAVLDQLTHYRLPAVFQALAELADGVALPAFWRELDGAARELRLYTSAQPARLRAAADLCRRHAGRPPEGGPPAAG